MSPVAQRDQEEAELHAVLASQGFAKSPNMGRLLQYICAKYWEGTAGELKEYHLAVEVLSRPPDFDPTISSVVRVEIHRLREKLRKFYEGEGADHILMIQLGSGNYVPQFIRRQPPAQREHILASAGAESQIAFRPALSDQGGKREDNRQPHLAEPGSERAPSFSRFSKVVAGLAGVSGLVVLVFLMVRMSGKRAAQTEAMSNAPAASTAAASTATSSPEAELRIIAGYFKNRYVDRAGHVWTGDSYFHGGTTQTQFLSHPLARSLDPTLFESSRAGEFSYDIPLKPASYEVRLYFVETMFGPGTLTGGGEVSRLFNVRFNGRAVLDNFDPYTDAGGNFIADVRAFKNVTPASDGYLHIQFERLKNDPFFNAVEILPELDGRLRPIRIVTQENTYTDRSGNIWDPDDYFNSGELAANPFPIEKTLDQGLYAEERFGRFSYDIPVAEGSYTLSLGFVETFFGPERPGKGGVGDRIFDLQCNGETLLHNFDIFKEAGGPSRALVKTFHGIQPNPQGKILLTFVPVKNYPLVNFIEVTDESH